MKTIFSRGSDAIGSLVAFTLLLGASSASARDLLVPAGTWHGVYLPIRNQISKSDITTFESQAGRKSEPSFTSSAGTPERGTTWQSN